MTVMTKTHDPTGEGPCGDVFKNQIPVFFLSPNAFLEHYNPSLP